MSSDDNDVVSQHETQFVYQSGDEDVLWAVQEITAERGNKYKVKWVGTDPDTGKPWAQSWVPKHDCTDDLVVAWKKKKKRSAERKRGRQTSTASRTSGASKRTGPLASGSKTRRSTSSTSDVVERAVSPPPKQTTNKRKRKSETPATITTTTTTTTTTATGNGVVQGEEQAEPSRPRKKQRTIVEVLLPPISSDDEEDAFPMLKAREKTTTQNKARKKSVGVSVDGEDGEDSSPPKAKGKSERRSETRSKDTAVRPRTLDVRASTSAVKAVPPRQGRVAKNRILSDESGNEDKEPGPSRSMKKGMPKPDSPPEDKDDQSEQEAELPVQPIKIGPPRGVKRMKIRKTGTPSEPGPSRVQPREDDVADECVPVPEPPARLDNEVSFFGIPLLLQNKADNHTTAPRRISTPQVSPTKRLRSPVLSPGAKARLELFDRMMAGPDPPPTHDVSEHVPDDAHFNLDDDRHDPHDAFETFAPPPPPSPPPPKPKPKFLKPGTPNGLIVPETESSGNSQTQSQSPQLFRVPAPPIPPQKSETRDQLSRKLVDLPTIAVIAASATSSSTSPQDLIPPQKLLPSATRLVKRPVFKTVPRTFRSAADARSSFVADSEPPLSSIESFPSPKRVDKGKQKAVEDDPLQISLSEEEGDGERQKRPTQKKMTDSGLRKRGKELFDQAQLAREAEWQKNKPKRLKMVNEIINGATSSPSKQSGPPATGGTEGAMELQLEDVVDLSGGGNSTTLDTQEQSLTRPLSEEERERLRFELRQEEEESTQEAMGIYPSGPVEESNVMHDDDAQMPPPASPKTSPPGGHVEDVGHVEQPSTDIHRASVIVQPSQGQRHEDVDIEPSPANQPTSSPASPMPENLTDSPGRRLGEALSLLNVKSEEIQRLESELADERKSVQGLKAELAELQQSSEPTGPVRAALEAERAQWTQERSKLENDLSTWETRRKEMSGELESVSARLAELSNVGERAAEAREKLSELEAERVAWTKERDVMACEISRQSEQLTTLLHVRHKHEQDLLEWSVLKRLWNKDRDEWETARTAFQEKQESLSRSVEELTASVESMRAAKASAEKDSDFFREQYVQASAFVDSVRDENTELEKRAKIAEGQAQEGVAAIKALFEGRVKALQADIDRWKGLSELLQEKDRRTNDELRLRAAQVPELVELCERLGEENKSLEAHVRRLDRGQQRSVHQRNRLFYEILLLKKERVTLRSKLSKLEKEAADSSAIVQETSLPVPSIPAIDDLDNVDIDPNDMEILPDPTPRSADTTFDEPALYPCMWRPQWRDQCQQIFDTKEDLERHMQEHFRDLI